MRCKFAALIVLLTLGGCAGLQAAKETHIDTTIAVPGHSEEQMYAVLKTWFSTQLASEDMKIETDK